MVVETLESPQQIIIPPGTASNTILNLERKGCYKLGNKSYRGNHYVHLQVFLLIFLLKASIFIPFKLQSINNGMLANITRTKASVIGS